MLTFLRPLKKIFRLHKLSCYINIANIKIQYNVKFIVMRVAKNLISEKWSKCITADFAPMSWSHIAFNHFFPFFGNCCSLFTGLVHTGTQQSPFILMALRKIWYSIGIVVYDFYKPCCVKKFVCRSCRLGYPLAPCWIWMFMLGSHWYIVLNFNVIYTLNSR